MKLKYYAFYYDFNGKKLCRTNVIRDDLIERVKYMVRTNKTYNEIREQVRLELMYHYWCKSEYEVIVCDLHKREYNEKIDMWYQIEPNLDLIVKELIRYVAPRKYKKILVFGDDDNE